MKKVLSTVLLILWMLEGNLMCAQVDPSFGDLVLTEDEDVEQTTPIAMALPCAQAPVVDGILDEPAWAEASRLTGFLNNTARTYAERQTRVSTMFDREALYIAMDSEADAATGDGGDPPLYAVMLQPPQAARPLVFCVSPAGALTDAAGQDIPATVATGASAVRNGRWTVELAVRFAGVGSPAPGGKASWSANFCRWWSQPAARTSWVGQRMPGLGQVDVLELGRLIFRREGPIIRMADFGRIEAGHHHLVSEIKVRDEADTVFVLGDAVSHGLLTRGAYTERPKRGEFYRLSVTTNQVGTRAIAASEFLSYTWVDKTLGKAYVRTAQFPVGSPAPIQIKSASYESRKTLRITADTWGLKPGQIGRASVKVGLYKGDEHVLVAKADSVKARSVSVTFPVDKLEPGTEYRIRGTLSDADGKELGYHELTVGYPDVSRWINNTLGTEMVVPSPWTPVRMAGDRTIACWGRDYRFAPGTGLPEQIVTRGEAILAGPAELTASTPEGPVAWTDPSGGIEQQDGTAATYRGRAVARDLKLETRSTVEYDGMTRIDITLTPARPLTLETLAVVIPVAREHARYLGVTDCESQRKGYYGALPAKGYRSGFQPFLWLGDEDRGVLWFCESARGWRPADPGAALEVFDADGAVRLRINLIGRTTRLDAPLTFSLGLQASPVRPLPPNWRAFESRWVFGPTTMEHFAYIPESLKAWTNLLAKAKAQGKLVSAYTFLNNVSTRLPEYNFFFDEWKRERNAPKSKYYADVVAPNVKTWQDFIVWSFNKGLEDFDIDGLYYDLGWPSPTTSPDHGGYVGEDGQPGKFWPIFALREIAKRAYVAFRASKTQTVFVGHCSGNAITLPILSFCDIALDGEQFAHHLQTGYMDQVPLDKMRAEFTCRPFGLMPLFLPSLSKSGNQDYTEKTEAPTAEMAALWYLHDCMIWQSFCHGRTLQGFRDAKLAFVDDPAAEVEFLPYWSNGELFSTDAEAVKVSAYRKSGACLLLVVNLNAEPVAAVVSVNLQPLALGAGAVRAMDAVNGNVLPFADGRLKLPLKGRWLSMVKLEAVQ